MRILVKCKLYFITLLAAVLSIAGTATSENQTDVSTGESKQMMKKPTIMILGSWHFADDVLVPKRQREIKQVFEHLKAFKPTKIAVELDPSRCASENKRYQGYLNGTYELERYEGDQIGYRLAKAFGHSKIYCVDYWPERNPILEKIKDHLINRSEFAKVHNQEHLFGSPEDHRFGDPTDSGKIEKYEPIIDKYIRFNHPVRTRASQRAYIHDARIGLGDQYPGADWLAHVWYARNLKIFVNLTRITESTDDRILLIIGVGHVYLVQQFLEESGDYIIESPLKYLEAGDVD